MTDNSVKSSKVRSSVDGKAVRIEGESLSALYGFQVISEAKPFQLCDVRHHYIHIWCI